MMLIVLLVGTLSFSSISSEFVENKEGNENSLFHKLQTELSKLTHENVSPQLKEMIASQADNTHWCCKIDVPIGVIDQTILMNFNQIIAENMACGTTSCGVFGWSSCTVTCLVYRIQVMYYIEHYTVYYQQECPSEQLICCKDHILVLGHCLDFDELQGNIPLLLLLQQEGILIPGLNGK